MIQKSKLKWLAGPNSSPEGGKTGRGSHPSQCWLAVNPGGQNERCDACPRISSTQVHSVLIPKDDFIELSIFVSTHGKLHLVLVFLTGSGHVVTGNLKKKLFSGCRNLWKAGDQNYSVTTCFALLIRKNSYFQWAQPQPGYPIGCLTGSFATPDPMGLPHITPRLNVYFSSPKDEKSRRTGIQGESGGPRSPQPQWVFLVEENTLPWHSNLEETGLEPFQISQVAFTSSFP